MRAALLEQVGSPLVVVDDVEPADPREGEVLVRIAHCGLCHSDVHQIDGTLPSPLPIVLGHEAAGTVEQIGSGVRHLRVGDRVVLTPAPPCGSCYWCVRGEFSICANSLSIATGCFVDGSTGLSRAGERVYRGLGVGAFAELVLIQASGAIPIDDDIPTEVACLVGCAVQTGVGAVWNTARVSPGDKVLVFGAGGVGSAVVQGAVLAGASRIIVSEPDAARRELALGFGATHVIDPAVEGVVGAARELTGGIGPDVAFDTVGHRDLVAAGMDATRDGGLTVMVGAPPIDHEVSVNVSLAMFREKKLVGSLLGSCHAPRDIPRLLDLWRAGRLDLDGMITARRPLSEINEAVADMHAVRGLRTVLTL